MTHYKIWDKQEDIWTPGVDPVTGKSQFTAQEYIQRFAPWAARPDITVVVGGGELNGEFFGSFNSVFRVYQNIGAQIDDTMTPQQVLDVIEDFKNNPPEPPPSPEERIAAALEFQNLVTMNNISKGVTT